jgi:hypothetical protein
MRGANVSRYYPKGRNEIFVLVLFAALWAVAYALHTQDPLNGLRETLMGIISEAGEAWRGQ